MLQFTLPPVPHYITGGEDTYPVGVHHSSRTNIGVFDLIFVTAGCLYITENGIEYEIAAGEYLILSPDGTHGATKPCDGETHFYWIHFQTHGTWRKVEKEVSPEKPPVLNPFEQIRHFSICLPNHAAYPVQEELVRLFCDLQLLKEDLTGMAGMKKQQLFIDLLSRLHEKADAARLSPFYLVAEKAAEYLRRNVHESLRYDQMSKTLHFHENYIALCMKKAFGCTPLEYLMRYRLEQGKHLVIHTDHPVGRISEEIGFNSTAYFIRCFTRSYGKSPKVFRQQYRQAAVLPVNKRTVRNH